MVHNSFNAQHPDINFLIFHKRIFNVIMDCMESTTTHDTGTDEWVEWQKQDLTATSSVSGVYKILQINALSQYLDTLSRFNSFTTYVTIQWNNTYTSIQYTIQPRISNQSAQVYDPFVKGEESSISESTSLFFFSFLVNPYGLIFALYLLLTLAVVVRVTLCLCFRQIGGNHIFLTSENAMNNLGYYYLKQNIYSNHIT